MLSQRSFLCLVLATALCAASSDKDSDAEVNSPIFLVNGRITNQVARVLVDCRHTDPELRKSCSALEYTLDAPDHHTEVVHLTDMPMILKINRLNTCHQYTLTVQVKDQPETAITSHFATPCPDTDHRRMIVVSCDRFADDPNDDAFLEAFADRAGPFDVMFHMGDQIYADKLLKLEAQTIDEAIPLYRDLYREAWSRPVMRRFLSTGSHIMVPDDHDVMNALSPENVLASRDDPYWVAGQRTTYEFQRALWVDVLELSKLSADNIGKEDAHPGVHAFMRVGSTAVAALDTRFYRSYASPKAPYELLGEKQTKSFLTHLHRWVEDTNVNSIVILTGLPLMWPSEMLSHVAFAIEGDKYPMHPTHRENLITILDALHEAQRVKDVILIGGDVHVYSEMQLCRSDDGVQTGCLTSLTSSGLTRSASIISSAKLMLFDSVLYWLQPAFHYFSSDGVHHRWVGRFQQFSVTDNAVILDLNASGTGREHHVVRPFLRPLAFGDQVRKLVFFDISFPLLALLLLALAAKLVGMLAACRCWGASRKVKSE
ncbi:uncharacterized protein MONBRDRAFT_25781 [Monosiga brevicollis MX1]|uniref:PhoD-like phosphatase metallophosphatase domain-containing protein n=1 Tax=Monosiga brevicollis TaxID=81824 RepID=A9V0E7_MONBE|nr:uncharacterized protein MONBRDRAFT_25781 [Monosiga brevicollis MX1]EDQ88997.1 predicted protein [Monosiga brevicollis MX1]|eukprot:XP_001746102.1 hypothetical protein [Monosiga brevicollis MX1]